MHLSFLASTGHVFPFRGWYTRCTLHPRTILCGAPTTPRSPTQALIGEGYPEERAFSDDSPMKVVGLLRNAGVPFTTQFRTGKYSKPKSYKVFYPDLGGRVRLMRAWVLLALFFARKAEFGRRCWRTDLSRDMPHACYHVTGCAATVNEALRCLREAVALASCFRSRLRKHPPRLETRERPRKTRARGRTYVSPRQAHPDSLDLLLLLLPKRCCL